MLTKLTTIAQRLVICLEEYATQISLVYSIAHFKDLMPQTLLCLQTQLYLWTSSMSSFLISGFKFRMERYSHTLRNCLTQKKLLESVLLTEEIMVWIKLLQYFQRVVLLSLYRNKKRDNFNLQLLANFHSRILLTKPLILQEKKQKNSQ